MKKVQSETLLPCQNSETSKIGLFNNRCQAKITVLHFADYQHFVDFKLELNISKRSGQVSVLNFLLR